MGKSTLKKWKEVLIFACVVLKTIALEEHLKKFESFQDRVTFLYID